MTDHPLSTPMQRRTVLAAAAATGVLAACGSSDDNGTTDDALDSEGSGSGEVLADVADVPVEGGTINRDIGRDGVVVTQPADGDYRAFLARCPHEGCTVSRVENNVITCPCHNSKFSAETGDVQSGPAPRGLAEIDVVVEGESIVRA